MIQEILCNTHHMTNLNFTGKSYSLLLFSLSIFMDYQQIL